MTCFYLTFGSAEQTADIRLMTDDNKCRSQYTKTNVFDWIIHSPGQQWHQRQRNPACFQSQDQQQATTYFSGHR